MANRTRYGDGWGYALGKIVELIRWILQPGGPLWRAVVLILVCTPVVVAVAVVVAALVLLAG